MKLKNYSLFVFFLFININLVFSWATDVEVSAGEPQGATSVVANAGGILYASVPQTSLNPSYAMAIYESTDNGASWTQLNVGAGGPGQVIVKSKMLVTGLNNIVCVYLLNDTIYTLDISSNLSTAFTLIAARDFDAAASLSGNGLYLFVDELTTNNIRRYGSTDAGLTWGGSSALVTGNGASPRVYMSGTRLHLSYFGPILSDTTLSIVRSANYDESIPGSLTSVSSSFQDIVTNVSVHKHRIQHVDVGGTVWFFWTEGDSPSVLKCRVSTDNGGTYGTEFTVAGSATMDVRRFDAKHHTNTITSGVEIAYYADSIQAGAADPFTESIAFTSADISGPQSFFTPQILSDWTVDASRESFNITLITYFFNFSGASGVLWIEDSGSGNSLYYDASSSTVNAVNKVMENINFTFFAYPNPVNESVNLNLQIIEAGDFQIELRDLNGRRLIKKDVGYLNKGVEHFMLDLSEIGAGIYFINFINEHSIINRKIIKM
ncbi:MAG TPA: T9SS type A sorting domain-containing protein [Bacteroidia bacterium]|nr:T9SS type A sorting domain-containing protein [Bacteroidia bacterium]HNS12764.1 T9SS type A sorting domain-containing protein [Bacteroidia bacterium]